MAEAQFPSSAHSTPASASRLSSMPPLAAPAASSSLPSSSPPPSRAVLQALPPHRRAEVLLQEMAGLTIRMLELAGAGKSWQGGHPRNLFPPSLSGIGIPVEVSTTKEVLGLLNSHQSLLLEAVAEISELQALEQEKQRVADAVAAKDAAMRDFAKRVRDAEQALERTLEEYDEYRAPKHQRLGEQLGVQINVQELISYAHKISYTTFAPPNYAVGQPGTLAPAPQEQQMRASQLYHFSDMDLGMPSQLAPPSPPPQVVTMEMTSAVEAAPRPPAAPVGLPEGIPPMPAGWRPGDPVPPRQPVRPPPAAGAVHHVPFVNLDLNPELEEDVSEYSDDEEGDESSDDDA